jgi:glycosyltransferase involved in cell wall biosynthesis
VPAVTYLISEYPAFNHTFILREVQALRAAGVNVSTISIRDDDRPLDRLTTDERAERAATWYVKRQGATGFGAALLRRLFSAPGKLARSLALACRLGGLDLGALGKHLFYWAEAVIVADHLTRTGAAHFHVHFASTVGLLAHVAAGCPFSITIHGPAEFETPRFGLSEKVRHAALIVTISKFGRSQVVRTARFDDWPKVRVVQLGVDTSTYTPRAGQFTGPRATVLTVGRLAPIKGHAVLIEAVHQLVARGFDLGLTIVGQGPERDRLERLAAELGISDRVEFTGALNAIETRRRFERASVFALTSFAEGIPVVLMEAMALGVPCVASRVTGVPELIEDGVTGYLVTAGDVAEAADAIARVLTAPEATRAMTGAAREQVVTHYDLPTNARRLAAELLPLLTAEPMPDTATSAPAPSGAT